MFKFGFPRTNELSTWIGGGGFVALLSAFMLPEQAEAITGLALAGLAVFSAFNKEVDGDA